MTSKCQIVPPDELRCIWMSAGIISYQLCDRKLDCDVCPLDAAMRKRFLPPESLSPADALPGTKPEGLRPDRSYSANHCWAKVIHDNLVRVGIEPGLGLALVSPKTVVLPAEGQRLARGQTCLWVVMEGGTFSLRSPIDGVVHDTNHQLTVRPHLLHANPLDHGWLYDLEVEAQPDFMTAEQAIPKFSRSEATFASLLTNALHQGRGAVGVTLADGGQQLLSAAEMLGPETYFALLRKVYG